MSSGRGKRRKRMGKGKEEGKGREGGKGQDDLHPTLSILGPAMLYPQTSTQ